MKNYKVEPHIMALIRKPRLFDGGLEWFNNGVQDVLGPTKPSCYCTGRVTRCSREEAIELYNELFPEPVIAGDIQNSMDNVTRSSATGIGPCASGHHSGEVVL